MAPVRGPAVPRRRLGAELRRLREAAHMLLEEAAHELECSTSKISRLETGKGVPRARDVRDLLDVYGVHDEKARERLLRWAREGQQEGWWVKYADLLRAGRLQKEHVDTLYALEADASGIDIFQTVVVPGLLQTPEYATALYKGIFRDMPERDVKALVELRMRRQQVALRKQDPVELTCVIDEAAFLRPVGGAEVMRGQARALRELTERPNVDIRVFPLDFGPHPAMMGPFTILRFTEDVDRDVVYVESHAGASYLEQKADLVTHSELFQFCKHSALDRVSTAKLLARHADGV